LCYPDFSLKRLDFDIYIAERGVGKVERSIGINHGTWRKYGWCTENIVLIWRNSTRLIFLCILENISVTVDWKLHKLPIETERLNNIPSDERICHLCGIEILNMNIHFFMKCSVFRSPELLRWPVAIHFARRHSPCVVHRVLTFKHFHLLWNQ
jgi:hypothetical protein